MARCIWLGLPVLLIAAALASCSGGDEQAHTPPAPSQPPMSRPPGPPSVTIAPAAEAVIEGEPARFTVSRTGLAASTLTVVVSVSAAGGVVSGAPPAAVTIAWGASAATFAVPTGGDELEEEDGTVTVTLGASAGYTVGSPAAATVIVEDNDAPLPAAAVLIVVRDANSYDSLLLEWTDGPAKATKWQYRQRRWENAQPLGWDAWTDIAHSGSATRGHRVSGLRDGTAYDFEVRAIVGAVAGEPSTNGMGGYRPPGARTHEWGAPLQLRAWQIAEGDGRTRWHIGHLRFVIPPGMQLVGSYPSYDCTGATATPTPRPPGWTPTPAPPWPRSYCDMGYPVHVEDFTTGSSLLLDAEPSSKDRVEARRYVVESPGGPLIPRGAEHSAGRSVHDLFDQLMDSVRVVPQ